MCVQRQLSLPATYGQGYID